MVDRFASLRKKLEDTSLTGDGHTPATLRAAAAKGDGVPDELAPLVRAIREEAHEITDADVASLKAKYSEDELFEVIVSASMGAARERVEAGLEALEDA
jgi:hypothetical protein